MKRNFFSIVSILIIFLLVSGAAAFAQDIRPLDPHLGGSAGYSPPENVGLGWDFSQGETGWFLVPPMGDKKSTQIRESPQVETGAPGLTFSHVQTFGVAERAYFDDTQHFPYPYGVAAVGSSVWIANSDGNRAVKFNSNGIYQNLTIGHAGFRDTYEDDSLNLVWIVDVDIDAGENIWLVDAGTHYVSKFDPGGAYRVVDWDAMGRRQR